MTLSGVNNDKYFFKIAPFKILGMVLFKWFLVVAGTLLLGTVVYMLCAAIRNSIAELENVEDGSVGDFAEES